MNKWICTFKILEFWDLCFHFYENISNLSDLGKTLQLTHFIKAILLFSLELKIVNVFFGALIFEVEQNLLGESVSFEIWSERNIFHEIKIFQMFPYLIFILIIACLKDFFPMLPRITILNKVFINYSIIRFSSLPSSVQILILLFMNLRILLLLEFHRKVIMFHLFMTLLHFAQKLRMICMTQIVQMRDLCIHC